MKVDHLEPELKVMYDKLYLNTESKSVKWPKNQALLVRVRQLIWGLFQDGYFLQLQGGCKSLESGSQRKVCRRRRWWGCHSSEAVTRVVEGRSRMVDSNGVAGLAGRS